MSLTHCCSRLAIVVASFALLALLGCGANDNVAACTTYVESANAALVQCGSDPQYSVDETCPESLSSGPDCTAYYDCLAGAYSCTVATQTVTAAISDCSC